MMRYEDLRTEPIRVISELMCFLLGVDSIEGTLVEARIKQVH